MTRFRFKRTQHRVLFPRSMLACSVGKLTGQQVVTGTQLTEWLRRRDDVQTGSLDFPYSFAVVASAASRCGRGYLRRSLGACKRELHERRYETWNFVFLNYPRKNRRVWLVRVFIKPHVWRWNQQRFGIGHQLASMSCSSGQKGIARCPLQSLVGRFYWHVLTWATGSSWRSHWQRILELQRFTKLDA